jgi:dihydroorotase
MVYESKGYTMSLLIRGGRVVDPSQRLDQIADVLVQDGRIHAIEKPGQISEKQVARVIDAEGLLVLPGFIDVHVHLREPGFEYKETIETGTKAAAMGGFTSVACMANTNPVNDSPYVTAFIRERAKALSPIRVFPIGAVSKGLKGEELAEIGGMVSEGARAISDDGMPVMNSYLMRKAMDYAKAFDVAVISHAEDANLVGQGVMNEGSLSNELGLRGNPAAAEEIMVAREIALCRLTRARVHIAHLSTQEGIEHVRRAKEAGLPLTAEATPHHLLLDERALRTYDTRFKMAPPLRSERDVEALRQAVSDGVVDLIATDHAPHGLVDKAVEFDHAACGILGLQTAIPSTFELVQKGIMRLDRWVESFTQAPAKLLGEKLGTLQKGVEADLTLIDPKHDWVFHEDQIVSKSKNSPFIGWKFSSKVIFTVVKGKVVYDGTNTRHTCS